MTTNVRTQAAELMADVPNHAAGRAAKSVLHGDRLRAVLMALEAGRALDDHTAPGPAVLQVIAGDLELRWGGESLSLTAGDLAPIPDAVHSVHASSRCAFLLTIALP